MVVALVRGIHGLKGTVRVEVLTDRPAERFAQGSVLRREGDEAPLTISWSAPVADGPGWRLRFREIPDRTAAQSLQGMYLEADVTAGALAGGEYWWHEVIGVAVQDRHGRELGTVRDVYRAGEAEVFTVDGGPMGSFDVPAVKAFLPVFDPRRGEIVVDVEALDLKATRREREPRDAG